MRINQGRYDLKFALKPTLFYNKTQNW